MKKVITLIALLIASSAFAVIENATYSPKFEIVSVGSLCSTQSGHLNCVSNGTRVVLSTTLGCGDTLERFEHNENINHDDQAVDIAINAVAKTYSSHDFYCISDNKVTKEIIIKSAELEDGYYDLRLLEDSISTSSTPNSGFDGYEHIQEEDDFEIKEIDYSHIF